METLNGYQEAAKQFARYDFSDPCAVSMGPAFYLSNALAGEVGEACNLIKKLARDRDGYVTPEFKAELKSELGDVLWYLSQLAREFGMSLSDIAAENLAKLESRRAKVLT